MTQLYPLKAPAFLRTLLAAAIVLAAAPGFAVADTAEKLLPSTARYAISINGMQATATRTVKPLSNDRWQAESNSSLFFFRILERSEFLINGNGITPLHYFHERTGGGDRNQNVAFDWANNIARNQRRVGSWEFPLESPLWDKLSLQLQLRSDLLSNRFEDGAGYAVLDGGKLKTYLINKEDNEKIRLDSGKQIDTVKLRQHREGKDRYTLVWMAPEFNYLIVRMEHHDDGELNTLRLTSAQLDGRTVK